MTPMLAATPPTAGRFYTGIGSRSTPPDILEVMERAAHAFANQGWRLRSGHAAGADQAFEAGANGRADIYLSWPSFEANVPVYGRVIDGPAGWTHDFAAGIHPAWARLTRGPRALHARNVHQVLGDTPSSPRSSFVLCWTPESADHGGTATAIRLAHTHSVPVFNLADAATLERVAVASR
jgi:hypothetical protein